MRAPFLRSSPAARSTSKTPKRRSLASWLEGGIGMTRARSVQRSSGCSLVAPLARDKWLQSRFASDLRLTTNDDLLHNIHRRYPQLKELQCRRELPRSAEARLYQQAST